MGSVHKVDGTVEQGPATNYTTPKFTYPGGLQLRDRLACKACEIGVGKAWGSCISCALALPGSDVGDRGNLHGTVPGGLVGKKAARWRCQGSDRG